MKRRKKQIALRPLEITEGPWTLAKYKPPRAHQTRSRRVLIYNGSRMRGRFIGWFNYKNDSWENEDGIMISCVTHWAILPDPPEKEF